MQNKFMIVNLFTSHSKNQFLILVLHVNWFTNRKKGSECELILNVNRFQIGSPGVAARS